MVSAGEKFGKWVVVKRSDNNKYKWVVRCDCGTEREYSIPKLRRGESTQCFRCAGRNYASSSRTHGMHRTPEYQAWRRMRERCRPSYVSPQNYHDRGITYHLGWFTDGGFERFMAHIGPMPSSKHTLDRINTDGNYEPGNVRWATHKQNSRNKRNSVFVEWNGEKILLIQLCEKLQISYPKTALRLRRGMKICKAVQKNDFRKKFVEQA